MATTEAARSEGGGRKLTGDERRRYGYAATWGVCPAAILLSVALLLRLPADGEKPA